MRPRRLTTAAVPAWPGLALALVLAVAPAWLAGPARSAPATAATAAAADTAGEAKGPSLPPPQSSILLHRVVTPFLPEDGLLRVGAGVDLFKLERLQPREAETVLHRDLFLEAEYAPLPLLHAWFHLPYRSWSGGTGAFPPSGSGLGDLDALLAVPLPRPSRALALAAAGGATLPTGDEAAGLSEGRVAPRALLAAGLRLWPDGPLPAMTVALNAGWRWNGAGEARGAVEPYRPWPPLYPAAAEAGDSDFLELGGAVAMSRGTTELYLEYREDRLVNAPDVAVREYPRWLTAGLTWGRREGPAVRLAYAVSLTRDDPGTAFVPLQPDLVTSVSFGWQFGVGGRDRDGDGVPDRRDRCPRLAEDRDGWQDDDGCPDLDNDGDGIPDLRDECSDQPEDLDGWQDEDGCPDLDNDGDGIPDVRDQCPDRPENFNGVEDDDGCPEQVIDSDGDGIRDRDDACPDLPEDFDGFEDGDGCPEADNDLDGIPDVRDQCPDQPEDYDGDHDDDGCPDPPAAEAAPQGPSGQTGGQTGGQSSGG